MGGWGHGDPKIHCRETDPFVLFLGGYIHKMIQESVFDCAWLRTKNVHRDILL